jgi:hypothetical protein
MEESIDTVVCTAAQAAPKEEITGKKLNVDNASKLKLY